MNFTSVLPDIETAYIPPFFNEQSQPETPYYKIYNDGGHYIATRVYRSAIKPSIRKGKCKAVEELFDNLYDNALRDGLDSDKTAEYIKAGILSLFPDYPALDKYIADKIRRKWHNLGVRKKRFRRKAYLNRWNYFVTFTFDDEKQSEETFRKKLRVCLSHLHTRRHWRYMGVFERAPETGRLHFHGVLYVPDGEMIGKITEKRDYSTKSHSMQTTHENDFFAKTFGRNDFEALNAMEMKHGNTLKYLLKYIGKTGERIVYGRGIPTEIYRQVDDDNIVTKMSDFVTKYILFDDVIDWERDVMRFNYRQRSIFDLICNPPRAA